MQRYRTARLEPRGTSTPASAEVDDKQDLRYRALPKDGEVFQRDEEEVPLEGGPDDPTEPRPRPHHRHGSSPGLHPVPRQLVLTFGKGRPTRLEDET